MTHLETAPLSIPTNYIDHEGKKRGSLFGRLFILFYGFFHVNKQQGGADLDGVKEGMSNDKDKK